MTTNLPQAGLNGSGPNGSGPEASRPKDASGALRVPDEPGEAPAVIWQGSDPFTQLGVLTWRSVRAWLTDPSAVLLGILQPVVILFLLTGVFNKVKLTSSLPPGITYFDFILPAILVDNAVQTSLQSGVGLIDDMKNGIVARLRSLPIYPSTLLFARSFTNLVRSAFQVVIILALAGGVLGHFPHSGATNVAISVGLTLLMGWSLGWVFLAASAWYRRAETMQNLAMVVIFPLMFASSAYVPVSDLPAWLAWVAHANPLTYAINATRALSMDEPGALHKAVPAALISPVLAIVGGAFAVVGFRRPSAS